MLVFRKSSYVDLCLYSYLMLPCSCWSEELQLYIAGDVSCAALRAVRLSVLACFRRRSQSISGCNGRHKVTQSREPLPIDLGSEELSKHRIPWDYLTHQCWARRSYVLPLIRSLQSVRSRDTSAHCETGDVVQQRLINGASRHIC